MGPRAVFHSAMFGTLLRAMCEDQLMSAEKREIREWQTLVLKHQQNILKIKSFSTLDCLKTRSDVECSSQEFNNMSAARMPKSIGR